MYTGGTAVPTLQRIQLVKEPFRPENARVQFLIRNVLFEFSLFPLTLLHGLFQFGEVLLALHTSPFALRVLVSREQQYQYSRIGEQN